MLPSSSVAAGGSFGSSPSDGFPGRMTSRSRRKYLLGMYWPVNWSAPVGVGKGGKNCFGERESKKSQGDVINEGGGRKEEERKEKNITTYCRPYA